jgi:hypothetical protein
MPLQTIVTDLIGSRTSHETLTATASDNQTNPIKIENCKDINIPVHYLAGATNQYASLIIEVSNKDTLPTASTDWEYYPSLVSSASENAVYGNSFIVPGDKVSETTTTERMNVPLNVNARWLRISVREYTNGGGDPSVFGSIYIGLSSHEEI